ncbi:MAG TPA: PEP-CTERM sorting domain-containing protein [Verrucomicrobiae bacterium]|jgi:hypothetical protein
MKHLSLIAVALTVPLAAMAQTTVFSDNFTGGSTIQSATPGAGTASSADYEVFGSTAATSQSIAANDLSFTSASGGSTLTEVDAQFGGSPVTLSTIGDYINLQVTFVDTANVMIAGMNSNSSLNIGLFNSGGVNLNQGQLLGTGGSITGGGSQTYQGYVSRLFMNGNASSYNRATQTLDGTTSRNQDLLFNNASSSAAFGAPNGTTTTSTFGTTTPLGNNVGLTAGQTYTISYTISLTAANAVKVTDELFSGSNTNGIALQDNGGTSTSGAFLGSTFDSLAVGFRYASATAATGTLDISDINVIDSLSPVPEPTTLALSALGGLGLLAVRRFKSRK